MYKYNLFGLLIILLGITYGNEDNCSIINRRYDELGSLINNVCSGDNTCSKNCQLLQSELNEWNKLSEINSCRKSFNIGKNYNLIVAGGIITVCMYNLYINRNNFINFVS